MIPSVEERQVRPCYDENYTCVFYRIDEDCCNFWCECNASKYRGPDDRRDRPCKYHITGEEVTGIIDLIVDHKLAKDMYNVCEPCLGKPSAEKCEDCNHLDYSYDEDIGKYDFWCYYLGRWVDDELRGRL